MCRRGTELLRLAGVVLLVIACGLGAASSQAAPTRQDTSDPNALIAAARATQAATRARLQVLGDAFECPDARFVSYRRSDFEPDFVDHWYVASQIAADLALMEALLPPVAHIDDGDEPPASGTRAPPEDWDAQLARCYVEKAHLFLDRQWDYVGGGFFPRSNATGTRVEDDLRFGDDNALTGLALIALAKLTDDPLRRQQYMHAARRQAEVLTQLGLWDTVFGGGFWWNSSRGASREGKPAQTNALAALFFGRLYLATGEENHRAWMLRTLLWLDTILWDPTKQLYRWSVSYQDLAARTGALLNTRYVNYDQSIAIEAQLLAGQLDGDPARLPRALAVGRAVQETFWVPGHGYRLGAGGDQVYTSYGAWTSLGHLALYDSTGDPEWLALARTNLDTLTRDVGEPDGGVGMQAFRCAGPFAQYCPPGSSDTRWIVDHIRDGAAQAWMQRLQVELARRHTE
jgi:hypothetical protein